MEMLIAFVLPQEIVFKAPEFDVISSEGALFYNLRKLMQPIYFEISLGLDTCSALRTHSPSAFSTKVK